MKQSQSEALTHIVHVKAHSYNFQRVFYLRLRAV